MARNEEKQLARLNRFYLEKERQENLKKRPPRPRLDSLTTSREIRKWIPSITQDIDFYVKQMEVPCYPESKLEEFTHRIRELKQEYTAFLRKLRMLDPETDTVSWRNRPYSSRKRCLMDNKGGHEESDEQTLESHNVSSFVPIATPVLQQTNASDMVYGFPKQTIILWNANPETQDQPLQFMPSLPKPAVVSALEQMEQHSCGANMFNSLDQRLPNMFTTYGQENSTSEANEISADSVSCTASDYDIVSRPCSEGPDCSKCEDVKFGKNAGNHEQDLMPALQGDTIDSSWNVANPAKTNPLNLDYSDTSSSSDEL